MPDDKKSISLEKRCQKKIARLSQRIWTATLRGTVNQELKLLTTVSYTHLTLPTILLV